MRWMILPLALCLSTPALAQEPAHRDLIPPTPDEIATQERVALVIGNADYEVGPLANPVNDAGAIAVSLEEVGFQVTLIKNASEDEIKQAIREFGRRIDGADTALFYYSGHGLQVDGVNYMVPVDAVIDSEADVEYEAVEVGRVLAAMEGDAERVNLVFLDACRNNPFARSWRSNSQGLANMDVPSGTLIAYAAAPGTVASDGAGTNSPYTTALIREMQQPGRKLEDVFKAVRRSVQEDTGGVQTPAEETMLLGDFYFKAALVDPPGSLVVSSEVKGEVFLDSVEQGRVSPKKPLTIDDVSIGPHTVWVEGIEQQTVTIQSHQLASVYFVEPPPVVGKPKPFWPGKGLIAIGGGVALGAGGLWAGALSAKSTYDDMVDQIADNSLDADADPVAAQKKADALGYAAQGATAVSVGLIGVGVVLAW